MTPENRLQEFFDESTRGKSKEYIKTFDDILANTIPTIKRKYFNNKMGVDNNENRRI
jgi:hypothetical protein